MNMHDKTVSKSAHTPEGSSSPVKKPVRRVRWFIIVGLLLAIVIGAVVGFNIFLTNFLKGLFANMAANPPPVTISVATAKSEVMPSTLTAVGDVVAVRQVDVISDLSGRVTEILFESGATVKQGDALVQVFDAPEQSDLASLKAQLGQAQIVLERAQALVAKQAGTQASVDQAQAGFDQAKAAVTKTETIISQKRVKAPFNGQLGVRKVELGQYLNSGTQIVSLTDLSKVYVNLTATEKDSAIVRVGQTVLVAIDAYPGRKFEGKITTIDPQISADTRSIRIQATLDNPEGLLKPGMFATTTIVLPPNPPVVTLPETAVDYTLYGDSVFFVRETKADDGTTKTTVERGFVRTGGRSNNRVTVVSGVKDGDRVVAVGQNKLQPGSVVTISTDPQPEMPANPPRN
jgi:membrane fusion protein, multidrug efflux system